MVGDVDHREWYVEQLINSDKGQDYDYDFVLQAVQLPSDKVLSILSAAEPQPNQRPIGNSVLILDGEEASRE